ncbi:MAG: ATP-binding protein [Chloroflexi bacterium]|nr:ATP-binding protein [Chloroflexota bacterium]
MKTLPRSIFPKLTRALPDRRVIVITGMRRVGKTTTVKWLLDQVASPNKLYVDLERLDNRAVFQESNYDHVLNFFRNRNLDLRRRVYVALDEIQYVPNVPSVIKYLVDNYDLKFILTGSSSFYLKNYFTESLAGRKVIYEMFPLTFGEFLDFHGVPYRRRDSWREMIFDANEYARLKDFYAEYLRYGGLPDVVLETRPNVKTEILHDIFSSYINIDVKTLTDLQKIGELQQLLRVLVARIGARIDQTKLATIVGISRPTVAQYLEFLEKTFILYRLPAFAGADRAMALSKKLYFYDNGIANVLTTLSEGAAFENAIFNQLRDYGDLQYLSKGSQYEIDFVLTPPSARAAARVALEVKTHPVAADAARLKRIADKHGLKNGYVIGRFPTPGFTEFVWGGLVF